MIKKDGHKSKAYRESSESWFYKKFIKNTVNDNFITPAEVIAKRTNKSIIDQIKRMNLDSD